MRSPDRFSMGHGSVGTFFRHGMVSGLRGSKGYSSEWVWNLRTRLCWNVVGKGIVSMTSLKEFYVGYML